VPAVETAPTTNEDSNPVTNNNETSVVTAAPEAAPATVGDVTPTETAIADPELPAQDPVPSEPTPATIAVQVS
jgi:hypothetical protein